MGFFILLGSIVYVVLAKFILNAMGKHTQSKAARYVAIAVFALIPTWDIVPGWLYFSSLCERETGTRVLKTVAIEQDYSLPDGRPDEKKLADRYTSSIKVDREFSSLFYISKIQSSIQDKQTGEVLGIATDLSYYGNWIVAYLFPQGPPSTCPTKSVHAKIWQEVFVRNQ